MMNKKRLQKRQKRQKRVFPFCSFCLFCSPFPFKDRAIDRNAWIPEQILKSWELKDLGNDKALKRRAKLKSRSAAGGPNLKIPDESERTVST